MKLNEEEIKTFKKLKKIKDREDLGDYLKNKDNRYEDYAPICSYIKKKTRKDQIEGGMAGVYNASITQRLNGLAEQSEVTQKTEQPLFGD